MKHIHKVTEIAHHRNGISGAPFNVLKFVAKDENRNMVAIVFDEPSHIAVFDLDLLGQGNIKFMENSWRGDNFEPELRQALDKAEGRE